MKHQVSPLVFHILYFLVALIISGLYIFGYWLFTNQSDFFIIDMILLFGAPFFVAKITSSLMNGFFQTKSTVQQKVTKSSTIVIIMVLGVVLVFLCYFTYLVLSLFIK